MTTRSRLSSGVRVLTGGLPDEPLPDGLPEHLIYEVLSDCESSMLIDLNLSDQNRRVQSKSITLKPNEYDFALNSATASVPSFAQVRLDPTETWQRPVDIVNLDSVDRLGIDGKMGVAFYGTPRRVRLSWIPQVNQNQVLTVWFDKTIPVDGDLSASSEIEDAYTTHMKLQTVAQIMELYLKQPIGDVLKARISKGESQWMKYVRMSGQQGVTSKPSSYPRRRQYGGFQRPGGGML